jgi:tetratricopeptide (TPR) repeat protein
MWYTAMVMKKKDDIDLSRLGRRSWVKETLEGPPERDDSIVTGYSGVPLSGIEELRRVVDQKPDSLQLKDMLAFMLYSNDRLDEALEVFRELAGRGHNVANQLLYLGNIYYRKGLLQLALTEWDKCRRAAPNSEEAAKASERARKVREGLAVNLDDR